MSPAIHIQGSYVPPLYIMSHVNLIVTVGVFSAIAVVSGLIGPLAL